MKKVVKKGIIFSLLLLPLVVIIPLSIAFFKKRDTDKKTSKEEKLQFREKINEDIQNKKEELPTINSQKSPVSPPDKVQQKVNDEDLAGKNQNDLTQKKLRAKEQSLKSEKNKQEKKEPDNPPPDRKPDEPIPNPEKSNQQPDRWMKGDDILNFYNSIEKEAGILFLDPLYLGDLVNKKGERRTTSINNLVRKKLVKNKLVFLPANQANSHWSLFVYEKETNKFHHYDSLGGLNFAHFSPLCEEILKTASSIKQEKTPRQPNGNDCGVYVMAIIDFLVKRYKNNPSKMNWEINSSEAAEIHIRVKELRASLTAGEQKYKTALKFIQIQSLE